MALLTIDYLEAAMGETLNDVRAAQAQFYIDKVSSYIEDYTGVTFSKVKDVTERHYSDDHGNIQLDHYPVTEVTTVHDVHRNIDLVADASYRFDGIETVMGLRARRVYDVTLSHGLPEVPLVIQTIATDAVRRALATAPTGLKAKIVGDVQYQYDNAALDFPPTDQEVLDRFGGDEGTIELPGYTVERRPGLDPLVLNGPDFWWYDDDYWF